MQKITQTRQIPASIQFNSIPFTLYPVPPANKVIINREAILVETYRSYMDRKEAQDARRSASPLSLPHQPPMSTPQTQMQAQVQAQKPLAPPRPTLTPLRMSSNVTNSRPNSVTPGGPSISSASLNILDVSGLYADQTRSSMENKMTKSLSNLNQRQTDYFLSPLTTTTVASGGSWRKYNEASESGASLSDTSSQQSSLHSLQSSTRSINSSVHSSLSEISSPLFFSPSTGIKTSPTHAIFKANSPLRTGSIAEPNSSNISTSKLPQTKTKSHPQAKPQSSNHIPTDVKPDLSFFQLIVQAISSTPDNKMKLAEIYDWISCNYPYYKDSDKIWKNNIRHNLSIQTAFVRESKPDYQNGKAYWRIDHEEMRHSKSTHRSYSGSKKKRTASDCSVISTASQELKAFGSPRSNFAQSPSDEIRSLGWPSSVKEVGRVRSFTSTESVHSEVDSYSGSDTIQSMPSGRQSALDQLRAFSLTSLSTSKANIPPAQQTSVSTALMSASLIDRIFNNHQAPSFGFFRNEQGFAASSDSLFSSNASSISGSGTSVIHSPFMYPTEPQRMHNDSMNNFTLEFASAATADVPMDDNIHQSTNENTGDPIMSEEELLNLLDNVGNSVNTVDGLQMGFQHRHQNHLVEQSRQNHPHPPSHSHPHTHRHSNPNLNSLVNPHSNLIPRQHHQAPQLNKNSSPKRHEPDLFRHILEKHIGDHGRQPNLQNRNHYHSQHNLTTHDSSKLSPKASITKSISDTRIVDLQMAKKIPPPSPQRSATVAESLCHFGNMSEPLQRVGSQHSMTAANFCMDDTQTNNDWFFGKEEVRHDILSGPNEDARHSRGTTASAPPNLSLEIRTDDSAPAAARQNLSQSPLSALERLSHLPEVTHKRGDFGAIYSHEASATFLMDSDRNMEHQIMSINEGKTTIPDGTMTASITDGMFSELVD